MGFLSSKSKIDRIKENSDKLRLKIGKLSDIENQLSNIEKVITDRLSSSEGTVGYATRLVHSSHNTIQINDEEFYSSVMKMALEFLEKKVEELKKEIETFDIHK